ncbi:MAG: hypothetical protein O2968_17455 [Acidobacteria bacterium]|nr:hypothetical protein [Acidobacteriota bacterium]
MPKALDWQRVYSRSGSTHPAPWWRRDDGVDFERVKIADVVNEWLILGDVRPVLHWEDWQSKPSQVKMHQPGLYPAIAYQLTLSVSTRRVVAICSGCGFGYFPAKAPSPGQRKFCDDCRDRGVDKDLAMMEFRKRKRDASALFRQGVPSSKIAKKVGSRESTVRRWVQAWGGSLRFAKS